MFPLYLYKMVDDMEIRDKKGFTLIELIMTVAIVSITLPLIFTFLMYCLRTNTACSNYISQQDKVTDVVQRIRKDVEEAKIVTDGGIKNNSITIILSDESSTTETWKFSDGTLKLNGSIAVDMLDTSESSLSISPDGDRLVLKILPERTNKDISRESNVWEPIVTEFSIRYKK